MAVRKLGGAFRPFEREKQVKPRPVQASSATSGSGEEGNGSARRGKGQRRALRRGDTCRQSSTTSSSTPFSSSAALTWRCRSRSEREVMMVGGLTTDEIKSHLQKYRLQARRPSPARSCSSISAAAVQFVLVSGTLTPPPENYTAATRNGASAAPHRIYAPVVTLLPRLRLHRPSPPKKRQVDHEISTRKPSDTGRTSLPSEDSPTNSTAFTGTAAESSSSPTTAAAPPF